MSFTKILVAAVLALPAIASAQLQLACPVKWDVISKLQGTNNLDEVVYGVKVRDWRAQHIDELLRKTDQCLAGSTWPESVRAATRADAMRMAELGKRYLTARDGNVNAEGKVARAQAAATRAGVRGIKVNERGYMSVWIPERRRDLDCAPADDGYESPKYWSEDSRRTFSAFIKACVEAGQMTEAKAVAARSFESDLRRDDQLQDSFAARVAALQADPARQNHVAVKELEEQRLRLDKNPTASPPLQSAFRNLEALRDAVDARDCTGFMKRAGMPSELMRAKYLIERNNPDDLWNIVCTASRNGVQVRYLKAGLGGKDGFELKGVRTVAVWADRVMERDAKTIILVPVQGVINGEKVDVVGGNFRAFTEQLIFAIKNM